MHIKHPEKSEEQQKADQVRRANELDWLMRPGVHLIATMKDEHDNYYIAVGVSSTEFDYKIPKEVEGVSVRLEQHSKITVSAGATDISYPLGGV